MRRGPTSVCAATLVALVLAGCGGGRSAAPPSTSSTSSTAAATLPRAHPQAIQPTAGSQAVVSPDAGAPPIGDTNAHAPPLAQVKRELVQLNLCGGATSRAEARPVVANAGVGFVADPGTTQDVGQLPELTDRLNALAQALHVTIYGISGYRTPAHSVAVGGFADDPHTKGEAEDIGVNSLLRSSAARISEAQLAQYGLYRPFDPTDDPANTEVNHIQLIPSGGPVPVVVAEATFAPDPTCK
ncbi:MAG TPA: D-Ala-D-Ala carboxypeptidase family metallohydrolase [Solirubrobacteraceae bacterium]|nr:D-Ala-D-Ala carboxypeptidase family metallohydrolase [Solirubrobacteraceae bacterium]